MEFRRDSPLRISRITTILHALDSIFPCRLVVGNVNSHPTCAFSWEFRDIGKFRRATRKQSDRKLKRNEKLCGTTLSHKVFASRQRAHKSYHWRGCCWLLDERCCHYNNHGRGVRNTIVLTRTAEAVRTWVYEISYCGAPRPTERRECVWLCNDTRGFVSKRNYRRWPAIPMHASIFASFSTRHVFLNLSNDRIQRKFNDTIGILIVPIEIGCLHPIKRYQTAKRCFNS